MQNPYSQALEFLVDAGVTIALQDTPNNRFENLSDFVIPSTLPSQSTDFAQGSVPNTEKHDPSTSLRSAKEDNSVGLKMHSDIIKEAEAIAYNCNTLEELKSAIQAFDGLSIKKTATQIVFADGTPDAKIMVIGEAPGADEDRQGLPFVGVSGQLLDKIFACIDLNRQESLYITNILNWRPPGNRTPTSEEMDIAKPFIMKHIELVNPDMLVLCGGVAAQTLLDSKESISRLRGEVHDVNGRKAIATYHPAFLLRTPLQKKKVWQDMLMLQEAMQNA